MRDIIFRGKKVDNDEWICGSLVRSEEYYDNGMAEHNFRDGIIELSYIFDTKGNCSMINPKTVGQHTITSIRHDKVNFSCYDGDIIEALKHNETKTVLEVAYRNGTFMFGNYTQHEFCNIFRFPKVIGNIHESKTE